MIRALLLVAREIAAAHDRWRARLVRRRPLVAEIGALRGTVERQRAQIDLLRARLFLYRPLRLIERDLLAFVPWFNAERPHQALGQRTPDEVHLGRRRRRPRAITRGVLAVRFIAGDRRLPVLRLRRAA